MGNVKPYAILLKAGKNTLVNRLYFAEFQSLTFFYHTICGAEISTN